MAASGNMTRVALLGAPTVTRDGVTVPVRGPQQRMVLSLLCLKPGRVLTAAELTDRAWFGRPPSTAASALRVHIASLRKLLGNDGSLPFTGRGYRIDPALVATDLADLDAAARTVPGVSDSARLATVDAALALWRGRPFGGLEEDDGLRIEADRLGEVKLSLEEARIDLILALGRHAESCPEIAALVAAEPLRERRSRQLMLAQYRSGRQSDALATYRKLRDRLADELGVDPAEESRRLELSILRQDASLNLAPTAPLVPAAVPTIPVPPPRSTTRFPLPTAALRALVRHRLAAMSPTAAAVVQMVAVLDGTSDRKILQRALDVGAADLDAAISAAQAGGLVLIREPAANLSGNRGFERPVSGLPTIALIRPELRDAVLAGLGSAELARCNTRAGRALLGPDADPARIAQAAWHLLAGDDPTSEDTGFAVVRAVEVYADDDHLEAAADLAERALVHVTGSARVAIQTVFVRILARSSRMQDAAAVWTESVAAARELGDPTRFALAVLADDWTTRSIRQIPDRMPLLQEALDRLGTRPSALRIQLQTALLYELIGLRDHADTEALIAEVTAAADELGDADSLVAVANIEAIKSRSVADAGVRRHATENLVRAAARVTDPYWTFAAATSRTYDAFCDGDLAALPNLVDRMLQISLACRSARMQWHHSLALATLHLELGNVAMARQCAEEAAIHGAAAGAPDTVFAVITQSGMIEFHLSGIGTFLSPIMRALEGVPGFAIGWAFAAMAHAHAGLPDGAIEATERAWTSLATAPHSELHPFALALLTETAATLQRQALTTEFQARLQPYTGQFLTLGQVSAGGGPVDRYLGLIAWLNGDIETALALLADAEAAAAANGMVLWRLRCAADRARVYRSTGDLAAAQQIAHSDHAEAAERGLGPCLAVFDDVLIRD